MALTKSVIFIEDKKQDVEKPVEFIKFLNSSGSWVNAGLAPKDYDSVRYLGKHNSDTGEDLFAGSRMVNGILRSAIFIGHLNSGKY